MLVLCLIAGCGGGETGPEDAPPVSEPRLEAPASLTLVEGETTTFSVRLVEPPSDSVTVHVASSNSANVTVSPAAIVLDAQHISADVTVTTAEDDDDVINETAEIDLSIDGGDDRQVAARVIDNDIQQIVADATSLTVTEAATGTFYVRLARKPSAPVTLSVWSDAPEIATVDPPTMHIDPATYSDPVPVRVTGVMDANTANGAANVYVGEVPNTTPARVNVDVIDPDVQGLVLSATNVPVTEGTSSTFTVSLAFDPLQPTYVDLESSAPFAATITPASLLFDSSNYNVPQAVTIAAPEDADQMNGSLTLALSGPASGTVAVPVTDNDLLRVQSPTDYVLEGTDAPFAVALADAPGLAGMTVTAEVMSGEFTVTPSSRIISNTDYSSFHPFTVKPTVDYSSTANRQATIRFSAPGQTPRDVTFTIYNRLPGQLNSISISGAGMVGDRYVSFTPTNAWPGDGRLVITFPPGFDASAATFLYSYVDGSYSITTSSSTIALVRSNGTPTTGPVDLRFGNIRNPQVGGSYPISLATTTGAGDPLDNGTALVGIGAGPLSNATVTLGDSQPAATTTMTFAFTTHNPWPGDGKLVIWVPPAFDMSAASVGPQSGLDGTFTVSVSGEYITLIRVAGTTTPADTPVSITLANVVNPATAQATYSFTLWARTATDAPIDEASPKGVVVGCPATITKPPQRGTSVPFGGDPWQYPDGVTGPSWGSDVAYIQSVSDSDYLVASDFQFTIPAGATVSGIRFDIERDCYGYNVVDSSVRVIKSTLGQTEHASTDPWTTQPVSYGGPTDLWGETWTSADFESSTFGVSMAVKDVTPGMHADVRVGYVTATLFLSCP